ncbi:MAG: hypothetical protein KIT62_13045 [Cyclobacteriaceae bacterium]|nr:hypothetical protein [Cyclobacteriaceae bacterium]
MELRDLIVTPLLLIVVYVVAYFIRPRVTDSLTSRYFFPALTVKVFGAIALGFIYQFYYSGGDTFNFHTHGSRQVWLAFTESPAAAFKLLFGGTDQVGVYKYTSKIVFYGDPSSYFVVRIASLFDLITFSSYSGTAVLFSLWSFAGSWALYKTFYKRYPQLHLHLAVCALFVPSVVFWGSGILKDTLVLGALGLATYSIDMLFNQKKIKASVILLLIVSVYIIFHVKLFILQAFLPAIILWVGYKKVINSPSVVVRILVFPFLLAGGAFLSYWMVTKVGENDARYAVGNIARTAQITAYDIGFYTGRDAGSGYSLGELDGTFGNMVAKMPQAINVSLFRPYLWEVRNPLMLLSALEGTALLAMVLYIVFSVRFRIFSILNNPDVVFALVFALTIAFAVGITSYNFGTLTRYRIPLLPYFTISLALLYFRNNERKLARLDTTEK